MIKIFLDLQGPGQSVLYGGRSKKTFPPRVISAHRRQLDRGRPHADATPTQVLLTHPGRIARFLWTTNCPITQTSMKTRCSLYKRSGVRLIALTPGTSALGDASLRVIPPPEMKTPDSNNNSVGLVVSYGEFWAALSR